MRRHLLILLLCAAFANAADPVFPYGAVYFRKSNPPEQDWARDHQTAARLGMNTFRHWFMWSAIEVAPGKYDWRDYDEMMDLAAKNGADPNRREPYREGKRAFIQEVTFVALSATDHG